jgi:RNA polymerase sigma-70 factor, ECF subfamily
MTASETGNLRLLNRSVRMRSGLGRDSRPEMHTNTIAPASELGMDPSPAADGFESFFRAESNRLFRALIVITGDAGEAEELTQEAFVKVWERWDRVASMENPTGYLYRTALNAKFQLYRRTSRAAKNVVLRESIPDPLDLVETRDYVARAILSLPKRQRAALVVTELLGYDSISAARILRVRPGTVRRLTSQARAKLREKMDKGDLDE